MLDYLRAEIYRVLHKRSMYIYFAILGLAYIALAVLRSPNFTQDSVLGDALDLFDFLPALVGGYLFAALYTDDLNSRNLTTLVGFGISKPLLIMLKFLLMLIFCLAAYACVTLACFLSHAALGFVASPEAVRLLCLYALQHLLATIAYAALAGIVVYGLQRTTLAIVVYILLSLGVVSGLLNAAFQMEFIRSVIPDLQTHLMSFISLRVIMPFTESGVPATLLVQPLIEYLIYVGLSIAASALAFTRKEMEF